MEKFQDSMLGRLYNGEEVSIESVRGMVLLSRNTELFNDMTNYQIDIVEYVVLGNYLGQEEDLEFLIQSLESKYESNMLTIYYVLTDGEWNWTIQAKELKERIENEVKRKEESVETEQINFTTPLKENEKRLIAQVEEWFGDRYCLGTNEQNGESVVTVSYSN